MTPHNLIDWNWCKTQGAKDYINTLFHRGRRRQFGMLERPSLPPQKVVNVIDYKIFVCGKSGVGKTSSIAKLAGNEIPTLFSETAGIETSVVYWPVFISANNRILFFRLNFWDVGDNTIKKFDHILPACLEDVDCVMCTFSFTDRSSFEEIPYLADRMSGGGSTNVGNSCAKFIIGTKADQYIHSDISENEIHDLFNRLQVPVVRSKNINSTVKTAETELMEISPILNSLCETLWKHEKEKYHSNKSKSTHVLSV